MLASKADLKCFVMCLCLGIWTSMTLHRGMRVWVGAILKSSWSCLWGFVLGFILVGLVLLFCFVFPHGGSYTFILLLKSYVVSWKSGKVDSSNETVQEKLLLLSVTCHHLFIPFVRYILTLGKSFGQQYLELFWGNVWGGFCPESSVVRFSNSWKMPFSPLLCCVIFIVHSSISKSHQFLFSLSQKSVFLLDHLFLKLPSHKSYYNRNWKQGESF